MASACGKKRRRSPINYRLFHEFGKRKTVEKKGKLEDASDISDSDFSTDCEFHTTRSAKPKAKGRSRRPGNSSRQKESDISSNEESEEKYCTTGFGRREDETFLITTDTSSSSSESETEREFDSELPKIVRKQRTKADVTSNRINPADIYKTTFSDTENSAISGAESEDDVNEFVQSWIRDNEKPSSSSKAETPLITDTTTTVGPLKSNLTDVTVEFKTVKKMAIDPNSSSHWRELGNQVYVTAHENLSPVIRRDRLRQATNHYFKAYNFSKTEDEKVSASKNLGMASWRMAQVEERALERLSVLVYFYKEAFKYMSLAWRDSEVVKPQSWRDGLLASAKACWEEMKTGRIDEMDVEDRKMTFNDIVNSVQIDSVKADIYVHLTNCHFHCGITAIQQGDYKKGLYEMKECHMPIHEARKCGKGIMNVEAETRILEEDVFMHSCMAESIQAREIGDGIFRKVTLDEENLQMDMVYEMIDWYKQAILRTREVTEVELEAIALSRMGRVYDKILKLKYKAKEYLMRSMQLAHSMHPRIFHGEDWFMECSGILERYQKETVQEEEAKWHKEREGLVKELEKELKEIEKQDKKSGEEFLKFVYKVHPPKNAEHKLVGVPKKKDARLDSPVLKKILQKAIVHYHPDRVDADKHGKTWKVLAEEITKCLTRRYECLKG